MTALVYKIFTPGRAYVQVFDVTLFLRNLFTILSHLHA